MYFPNREDSPSFLLLDGGKKVLKKICSKVTDIFFVTDR